jgi:hypothetical protein
MEDEINFFQRNMHLKLESVIEREFLSIFFDYAKSHLLIPNYFEIEAATRSFGRYADALGEVVLIRLLPLVERVAGKKLYPTYSYLRFYTPESRLDRHIDRASCEYSLTLTIGGEGSQKAWPILLERDRHTEAIELKVGDALLFEGAKLPHWREPLSDGSWLQLFMHYVDANGPHAAQKFDGRRNVGPWTRRAA